MARAVDITTLDPERMWCDTCMIILKATYEQMINVDPNDVSHLLPGLAESWEVNDTSTEFTFTAHGAAHGFAELFDDG